MDRDFTFSVYERLCTTLLENSFNPITINDFIVNKASIKNAAIIRHDVDRKPNQALKMARLENQLGIVSTYYFRTTKEVFIPEIISEISKLNHEIGYHYEVLALNNGNKSKAIKQFEEELELLREISKISTICMHGSPLSNWRDSDMWDDFDYKIYGIVGEAYLSIDYSKVHYFTDTGRRWDGQKYNVRDKVKKSVNDFAVRSTEDLINLIPNLEGSISINAHPQRWHDKFGSWISEFVGQNIKNMGKRYILKNRRGNK